MNDMSKRINKLVVLALIGLALGVRADEVYRKDFPSGASLTFSKPVLESEVNIYGRGWKSAVYSDGRKASYLLFALDPLTLAGGVVYDTSRIRISRTGRYVVLDMLRIGTVDSGPNEKPFVDSKEYCPVMDTTSGCVLSNNSGAMCSGQWDVTQDKWLDSTGKSDLTGAMLNYQFAPSNLLWTSYLAAKNKPYRYPLKDAVRDNLGAQNMLMCERIDQTNTETYNEIADELEAEDANAEATILRKALKFLHESATIAVPKAFLFDAPDVVSQTKAYLVKGDLVEILDRSRGDWVLIEYSGKRVTVRKWIYAVALN